jgi:hypothetical protein
VSGFQGNRQLPNPHGWSAVLLLTRLLTEHHEALAHVRLHAVEDLFGSRTVSPWNGTDLLREIVVRGQLLSGDALKLQLPEGIRTRGGGSCGRRCRRRRGGSRSCRRRRSGRVDRVVWVGVMRRRRGLGGSGRHRRRRGRLASLNVRNRLPELLDCGALLLGGLTELLDMTSHGSVRLAGSILGRGALLSIPQSLDERGHRQDRGDNRRKRLHLAASRLPRHAFLTGSSGHLPGVWAFSRTVPRFPERGFRRRLRMAQGL